MWGECVGCGRVGAKRTIPHPSDGRCERPNGKDIRNSLECERAEDTNVRATYLLDVSSRLVTYYKSRNITRKCVASELLRRLDSADCKCIGVCKGWCTLSKRDFYARPSASCLIFPPYCP
ncbi:unnamed protein product [Leptosia nina]|uniref:Uncharacterized protein n=1 Tax=Leptosia nina TaxID=320188 RepID=A0AAV1J657_9NEOP